MATPQETADAADDFVEAYEALTDAQAEYDSKEAMVTALVAVEQQALEDAQAAFSAALTALDTARTAARSSVDGWFEANAALALAASAYDDARAALVDALSTAPPV